MSNDYTYTKSKGDEEKVIFSVKIDKDKFVDTKANVFKKLSASTEIKGFRPGKAPQALLETKLGPDLYEETLNELLPKVTLEIIQKENLEPITRVTYEVKKMSDAEGIEYEASFFVYPEIKLGDFTKINVKVEDTNATKEEIEAEEKRLLDIYNQRKEADKAKGTKDKADEANNKQEKAEKLTDEIVKELAIGFDSVEKLREEIKKQLEQQKKMIAEEKKLKQIVDEAIKLSNISAPHVLIHEEVDRREAEYKNRIEKLKINMDDFLKAQNTTWENLRNTWHDEAESRVKTDLLLFEIVKTQKLAISDEDITKEINAIKDEKLRKEYESDNGKRYIATIMLQQKALEWLKNQIKA